MMRSKILMTAILIFSGIMKMAYGQEALEPRASPLDMATVKSEDTYIKITYGRPQKKGRVVFGTLVPYGKIWETGANEVAELTCTRDIRIDKHRLKAGTYALFTIPEKDQWTIILNSDVGQWGVYNYNSNKDVLRFTVPVSQSEVVYEPFTIKFEEFDEKANLILIWDRTKVSIPIAFIK
jgi:hypothetical protein